MKKILLLFMVSLFVFPFGMNAQNINQESKKSLYERKVISFTKMKKTGMNLTFGGALLTAGGVALMINGVERMDGYNSYNSNSNAGDGEFFLGYAAFLIGGSATTGGIVLWAIGGSKKKSYQRKLNSLSFNLNPGPRQAFTLAYKF